MSSIWIAPPGSLGGDTSGSVNIAQCEALRARGWTFLIRALAVPNGSVHPAKLTAAEVLAIRSSGLALGLYQTFQTASLSPSEGTLDGESAVAQARALGVPPGVTIYGDSEGQGSTSASQDIAYWNAWAAEVRAGGYVAGMYVGPGPRMTGVEIGELPDVHAYWMAGAADMPYPYPRGYGMFQLNPPNQIIAGQAFDLDVTQVDFRGGAPAMWAAG